MLCTPTVDEEPVKKMPKFSPFTGSSRRLDGKPAVESDQPTSTPALKQHLPEGTNGAASSHSSACEHSGKLVFGSNEARVSNGKRKVYFSTCKETLIFSCWLLIYLANSSALTLFLTPGCFEGDKGRYTSEDRRSKVPSIYREEVLTQGLTAFIFPYILGASANLLHLKRKKKKKKLLRC